MSDSDEKLSLIKEISGLKNDSSNLMLDENGLLRKIALLCPFCNEDEDERTWGDKTLLFNWEEHTFHCSECDADASPYETLLSVYSCSEQHREFMQGFARLLPLLIPEGYSAKFAEPDPE